MHDSTLTNRRTVLKTLTATVVGTGITTGTGTARDSGGARSRPDVEVVAKHDHESEDHLFELSTDEVAAGWTTFELDNQSEHAHFTYLAKLPQDALDDAAAEGMSPLEFYVGTVTKPFQYFMDLVYATEKDPDPSDLKLVEEVYPEDRFQDLFAPWYPNVTFHGGVGLTAGHTTATTTLDLDPGVYTMECYVKNGNNDFHSYLGMIEQLDVTSDDSGTPEPEATLDVTVSTDGIDVGDGLRPGRHTIGVKFADQKVYQNLVGHDLHLIRLDDGTTVSDVNDWMNWTDPDQLIAEDDEPTTFLGGVQDITAGLPQTGYVDVQLEPGEYAFVAEIPDPKSKGLLTEFSVPVKD